MTKLWAHSGDAHFLEPESLYRDNLPAEQADRLPRSERDGDWEIVHVDGEVLRRRPPKPVTSGEFKGMDITQLSARPPGSRDVAQRLADLDEEGIWGELVFPSLGMWNGLIKDPELVRAGARVVNDWALEEIQSVSERMVCTATVSLLDVDDAVAEVERTAEMGYKAVFLPVRPPGDRPAWNRDYWEPLWTATERAGMVAAFHIGTEAAATAATVPTVLHGGPGGAVLNYVETSFPGQRVAVERTRGDHLDRHPDLKMLVAEAGASWVPYLGDRMNEAYRQHGMFVTPTLTRSPMEILYTQVYSSFQHDVTAVAAMTAMGYRNVIWGDDYPHLEGTYGHTQKTLHELFDGVDPEASHRIRIGAFLELFPHVGEPPAEQ